MKFLLAAINAKYIHSNPAVYSLKAYAANDQKNVEIAEYTINHDLDRVLADIYKRKPDAVGFSCYLWNIRDVRELSGLLEKVLPDTPVWLGGPEVSYEAEEQLNALPSNVKGIMLGEGEETFRELLAYYHGEGPPLNEIRGLCCRVPGTIIETPSRPAMDLNQIPFPYQDLSLFENRIVYYESSRGCPFSCSYCLSSLDRKLRFRELGKVKEELQFFLDNQVPQVKFIDRTFNCNKTHAIEIWRYLLDHDNGVSNFHFEIAADLLDDEMVELIGNMRPGLIQLEIGVQTTCEKALAAICRRADLEKVKSAVARIHSFRNTHQHLDLIAGLPWEDFRRFAKSFDEVYQMEPDQLQLGFLKVLRGTAMKEQAGLYGLTWHDTAPYEVLSTYWLSYGELLRLKQIEALVETYYNSRQFSMTLKALRHRYKSPFRMFEELADYFEACGFEELTPNREEKYQRLRAFLETRFPEYREADRQLLTWDCYLRENTKKRPDFAISLDPWKKKISDFFAEENKQNLYFPHLKGVPYRQLIHDVHMEVYTVDIPELVKNGVSKKRILYVCYEYAQRTSPDLCPPGRKPRHSHGNSSVLILDEHWQCINLPDKHCTLA